MADHRETLMNWLKKTQGLALNNTRGNLFFGLIYRASRDGWAAADFHSRCDYKGPTVTVIMSGKSIFGGYTEQQWKHVGKHFKQVWSWFPDWQFPLLFQGSSNVLVVLLTDARELLGYDNYFDLSGSIPTMRRRACQFLKLQNAILDMFVVM